MSYSLSPVASRLAQFRTPRSDMRLAAFASRFRGRSWGMGQMGQASSLLAMSVGVPSSTESGVQSQLPLSTGDKATRPEAAKADLSHFVTPGAPQQWTGVQMPIAAPDNTLTYVAIGGAVIALALITFAMRPAPRAAGSVSPNARRRRKRAR